VAEIPGKKFVVKPRTQERFQLGLFLSCSAIRGSRWQSQASFRGVGRQLEEPGAWRQKKRQGRQRSCLCFPDNY